MSNAPQTGGGRKASGYVFAGPTGSTAPTDAKTAVPATFKNMGLVSDAGLTRNRSQETTDKQDWSGVTQITIITSDGMSYDLVLQSIANVDMLKELFGAGNVTEVDGLITIAFELGTLLPERSFVFDMVSGENLIRDVVYRGRITKAADSVAFVAGELIELPITITAYPVNGIAAKEFIEVGALAPAA